MYLTERFAELVTGTKYDDIPQPAIAKAKDCILDCIGVAIAVSAESISAPVMRYLEAVGGAPDATLVGIGAKTSVTNAALANGVFGHVLDYDDTNQIFIGRGSVVIVPAILALAEKLGSSGRDVLAAYMVGIEEKKKGPGSIFSARGGGCSHPGSAGARLHRRVADRRCGSTCPARSGWRLISTASDCRCSPRARRRQRAAPAAAADAPD